MSALLACLWWVQAAGALADAGDAPRILGVCGITFDLPQPLRITTPVHGVSDEGVPICTFDIVPRAPLAQDECRDADEGGSPPYDRCDWRLDAGSDRPAVQVARMRLEDRLPLAPFVHDGSRWTLPNAQAGDQPATAVEFFGHRAWEGEIVTRMYWWRARTPDSPGIHGGSAGSRAILLQLDPRIAVALIEPPLDEDGACRFCASLRPLPLPPRTGPTP